MPRPKSLDSPWIKYDVRITPTDGLPIWGPTLDVEYHPPEEDFEVFVACEEGGTDSLRLHYHIYCVSNRSETYLRKLWATLGRATIAHKGNSVFRMAKAHDHTIGYVVKGGNVVCRHGWTDLFLDEMLKASKDYRKGLETTRKKEQRKKEAFLSIAIKSVRDTIANKVKNSLIDYETPREIISLLLQEYATHNVRLPNRTTIETATMTIMYAQQPDLVLSWYAKTFDPPTYF